MSKKYFTSLLFLQFWPAPMPSSVFKIALFPKLGIYLLKVFFSMILQVIVLQDFPAELLFWWKGIGILSDTCLASSEWLVSHHQRVPLHVDSMSVIVGWLLLMKDDWL